MRFFKAFNLLHRRTKSATFVPGSSAQTSDFPALSTTNVRNSSFTIGEGCSNTAPLSLFDLVTSNPSPVPLNFNHLHDTSDRVRGIWRSRRNSDRSSLASLQSSVNKELSRLSEAVNFWISEYAKIQNLLRQCHEQLVAERRTTARLEKLVEEIRHEENAAFGTSRGLHEKEAGNTSFGGSSGDSNVLQSQKSQIILYPRTQLSTMVSLGESIKPRTLDEYSSALRMTLTARRELRDQKKISKFWKNLAVSVEGLNDTITPSVSNISSIQEAMPADRRAAVQDLISRRAVLAKLKVENGVPMGTDSTGPNLQGVSVLKESTHELTSSLSKSSGFSRLEPLASESIKQEINLLFGSSSIPKCLTTSSHRNGSLENSGSTSFKAGLSGNVSHSLSIESFQDISMIFQRAFGVNKRASLGQLSKDSDPPMVDLHLPVSISDTGLIASSSSARLPNSSLVSAQSQVWVNVDSPIAEANGLVLQNSRSAANASPHTIKLASKECTSRRSWQKYIVGKTSTPSRGSGEDRSSKEFVLQRSTKGKENSGISMPLPASVFKRRNSRLPVPVFAQVGH